MNSSSKKALIIIDMQNALFRSKPENSETLLHNILLLLSHFRKIDQEVIFVRHNDSTGWEIISELAPLRNEKIIDKIYNSAFHDTELHVYLKNKNISSIILVGMQTEYCMDASCKTAFDLGYQITIPLECHALFQMICALLQQYQSCLQIVFGAIDLQTSALQEIY